MPDLSQILRLFEYGTCSDPEQAAWLYDQRDVGLKPYLNKQLKLRFNKDGQPSVFADEYVGVLPFNVDGKSHLLYVAPKGCQADERNGLLRFLELLAFEKDQKLPDISGWEGIHGPHLFLLFLAHFYGRQLKELCRRDFRSYYRHEEGDLRSFIRGRLNLPAYARLAVRGKPHILPCRWDEFTVDNWDNRILWGVARRLKRVAGLLDTEAARQVWEPFQGLVPWFGSVADMPITAADFRKSRLGRMSRYYRRALAWARLLLQGSDLPTVDGRVPPLVLSAPAAFENFAKAVAKEALPSASWHLDSKEDWHFLAGQPKHDRRPDIPLSDSHSIRAVGDAKYKDVLEGSAGSSFGTVEEVVNVGIKAQDWNQLYVYMRLRNATFGFFIVPFWNAEGPYSRLLPDFRFEVPPCDGDVRVAVLGLNLLKPLKDVKIEAADKLKSWLGFATV